MSILFVRDPHQPLFGDVIIERALTREVAINQATLLSPTLCTSLASASLCMMFLQDPCDDRPGIFAMATELADTCRSRGIPLVNPPENLPKARKLYASIRMWQATGVRTPFMLAMRDKQDFDAFPRPFFVRENGQHTVPLYRVDRDWTGREEALNAGLNMKEPVLVELMETAKGGIYRKYRYVVAGNHHAALHLQHSRDWITRGKGRLFDSWAIQEEQAYINENKRVDVLHDAACALGFDFCAFDYTYDLTGRLLVWECNPFPGLHYVDPVKHLPTGDVDLSYRNEATTRALDALIDLWKERSL